MIKPEDVIAAVKAYIEGREGGRLCLCACVCAQNNVVDHYLYRNYYPHHLNHHHHYRHHLSHHCYSSSLSSLLFYVIDMNVEAGPVGVSATSGMLF
jgi:hypothetical protein